VGTMKGAILSVNPAACIVDITHQIPPQDIHAAAFNLLASYQSFPEGTIHVAVVDPGVGSKRRPLLIECAGQFFVGPDNGIFSWICERENKYRTIHLNNEKFFRHPVSATFHGRDIFAPVAAAISLGSAPAELGELVNDMIRLESLMPKKGEAGAVEASIIHIDRFGNCITNLTPGDLSDDFARNTMLTVNDRQIRSFRRFFAEQTTPADEVFLVLGSAGFLEIAAENSSAAGILNAVRGQRITLTKNASYSARGLDGS